MAEPVNDAPPAAAQRAVGGIRRLRAAWGALAPEQRLVAYAALALLFTMFLPWYSTSFAAKVTVAGRVATGHDRQSAIGAFSWVEAAVLLVALGVLTLLFARGERRAFHLPGGDGTVITGAGVWASLLIIWRFFDKPDLGNGVSVGLEWGIFVALIAAVALALAGNRLRAARRPEPAMAPEEPAPAAPGTPVPVRIPDERPHLEETRVMAGRARSTAAARRTTIPLSRETAAQDTAEFRALPSTPAGADEDTEATRALPSEEETQALPGETETQALPGEEETKRLPPPDQAG
jgi:hypothetical protein